MRQRTCYPGQQCDGTNYEVDSDLLDEDFTSKMFKDIYSIQKTILGDCIVEDILEAHQNHTVCFPSSSYFCIFINKIFLDNHWEKYFYTNKFNNICMSDQSF